MDNSKMIVLGGGAFACFALGYFGLHYMGGESIEEEESIKNEVNNEINTLYNEVDTVEKKEEKVTGWGQFWKGAYEDETTKNEDSMTTQQ